MKPIIVEQIFDAPISKVWRSLTDNEQLKKWYFQLKEFKPKVGFKFDFIGGADDGPQYLHLCEITEIVNEAAIAYSWRYDNYPGNSTVLWEIFEVGDKTRLKLTHSGVETFIENGKDFQRESFIGGWNYFVNDALKTFLESEK